MIQPERVRRLNDHDARKGRYVLYWMQAAQRAECNHALEYAIRAANELSRPVIVGFGLTECYPEANERHYAFLLEGLREVARALRERGVQLVARRASPDQTAIELSGDACLTVTDRGYQRIQKQWRSTAAKRLACPLFQVETDVIVPVEVASPKEEYAAATLRPKIARHLPEYLVPLRETPVRRESLGMRLGGIRLADPDALLARLDIDRSTPRVRSFRGGTSEANRLLDEFVTHKLRDYPDLRNEPSLDYTSQMSPYLHFGQISPLTIAIRVLQAGGPGRDAYLEQLIVRRELSMNFVEMNPAYDSFACLPAWVQATLREHTGDRRETGYSPADMQSARTHDPYWNAAQRQMLLSGTMHNTMRMYWGKKILEWSATPEDGFRLALYLNNRYQLDGRDPNGFAGVAWCFGKHDRAWKERAIFGKVRYMNAAGLDRKYDMDAYVKRVDGYGSAA